MLLNIVGEDAGLAEKDDEQKVSMHLTSLQQQTYKKSSPSEGDILT
jgi:hypothetical protein